MSPRCRNCGRRSSRRHPVRHRRTVFSQGHFWTLVAVVLLVGYLISLARGQA